MEIDFDFDYDQDDHNEENDDREVEEEQIFDATDNTIYCVRYGCLIHTRQGPLPWEFHGTASKDWMIVDGTEITGKWAVTLTNHKDTIECTACGYPVGRWIRKVDRYEIYSRTLMFKDPNKEHCQFLDYNPPPGPDPVFNRKRRRNVCKYFHDATSKPCVGVRGGKDYGTRFHCEDVHGCRKTYSALNGLVAVPRGVDTKLIGGSELPPDHALIRFENLPQYVSYHKRINRLERIADRADKVWLHPEEEQVAFEQIIVEGVTTGIKARFLLSQWHRSSEKPLHLEVLDMVQIIGHKLCLDAVVRIMPEDPSEEEVIVEVILDEKKPEPEIEQILAIHPYVFFEITYLFNLTNYKRKQRKLCKLSEWELKDVYDSVWYQLLFGQTAAVTIKYLPTTFTDVDISTLLSNRGNVHAITVKKEKDSAGSFTGACIIELENNTIAEALVAALNQAMVNGYWVEATLGRSRLQYLGLTFAQAAVLPEIAANKVNERQLLGITHAIDNPLTLIAGPPGTGKTRLILLLVQYLRRMKVVDQIHIIAPSNVNCNEIAMELDKRGLKVLRETAQSAASIDFLDIDAHINKHPSYLEEVRKVEEEGDNGVELDNGDNQGPRDIKKEIEDLRNKWAHRIRLSVEVIVTTSMHAAHYVFRYINPDCVIVDECARMTELDAILSIKNGCKKAVFVGDIKQMGPRIYSSKVRDQNLGVSILERLMHPDLHNPVIWLTQQYRMNSSVMQAVNHLFYFDHRLEMAKRPEDLKKYSEEVEKILPASNMWIQVDGQECRTRLGSMHNITEAEHVCYMAKHLISNGIDPSRICIMSGYQAQVDVIKDKLAAGDVAAWLPDDVAASLPVKTFDAMQGGEADYVIVSLVRSKGAVSPGFLDDPRMQCFFLSRSKVAHIMIGNGGHLSLINESYRRMVNWYIQHGCFYLGDTQLDPKKFMKACSKIYI